MEGSPSPETVSYKGDTIPPPIIKHHRKVFCRYGRGCTHIADPVHNDRFWHPPPPRINDDLRRAHYICIECGYSSQSLQELQVHLQRKTAWSNASLVGCRVSCLVECKEWHEAFVAQFHRSGKHLLQFRVSGENKWLNMTRVVFYIVERPLTHDRISSGEFKDCDSGIEDYLAPLEEDWVYVEDISLDFTFAQSVLFKIYGGVIQETGHKTRGHVCLTDEDRENLNQTKGSFLYGELLPRGANKAFRSDRLDVARATSLFDLGMGTGKIAIQAFLQFRNLQYVYGVELSSGRYSIAEEAIMRMVELLGPETLKVQNVPGRYIVVTELDDNECKGRVLHLECGDMFDVNNIDAADIVMMETDVPLHLQPKLCQLLSRMRDGSRVLSYLDFRRFWSVETCPFTQMENNRHLSDRFPTSWSVQRGHHFYLWTKGVKSGTVDSTQTESTMPLVEPVNPKVDLPEDVERQAQQTRCLPRGLQSGAENISSQKINSVPVVRFGRCGYGGIPSTTTVNCSPVKAGDISTSNNRNHSSCVVS